MLRLNRRAFVKNSSLCLLGASITSTQAVNVFANDAEPALKVGLVTDMHYADKPSAGTRHYRETLDKLAEAGEQFTKDNPAMVVELGDFVDRADSVEVELGYLRRILKDFAALPGDKHYVLGNHCVDTLHKEEFLDGVGQEKSYYSFDRGGYHFVVLDSCFRSDGKPYGRNNSNWKDANIPAAEVEWLAADLKTNRLPTVVFAHQRLDASGNHTVKNAAEIRKVFEASGNVAAVFQGHSHQNEYREVGGIHYCVLAAMVEGSGAASNGYSMLHLHQGGHLKLTGFRRQKPYDWA